MVKRYIAMILGVFAIGVFLASSVFAESGMEKSLYDRLGGYDAVSAVVDDFAGKLFVDPVVGKRFFGMSDDSREGFRQKNKNLVCAATGGPCKIISRSAATTHGGLGIKTHSEEVASSDPHVRFQNQVFTKYLDYQADDRARVRGNRACGGSSYRNGFREQPARLS